MLVSSRVQYMHDFTWLFLLLLSHSVHPHSCTKVFCVCTSVCVSSLFQRRVTCCGLEQLHASMHGPPTSHASLIAQLFALQLDWSCRMQESVTRQGRFSQQEELVYEENVPSSLREQVRRSVTSAPTSPRASSAFFCFAFHNQHACVCFSLFKAC